MNFKNIIRRYTYFRFMRYGKFVMLARKTGWYELNMNKSFLYKVLAFYYKRKKNKLGEKLNIEFDLKEFGRRLKIYHGNIVVNGSSVIGDDCELHGNNCIGNKGPRFDLDACPILGNSVVVGYGSNIIGKISIANNTIISANTLVNKNIIEEGYIYGGIPAKLIKGIE